MDIIKLFMKKNKEINRKKIKKKFILLLKVLLRYMKILKINV
jgi:hypothetical protein